MADRRQRHEDPAAAVATLVAEVRAHDCGITVGIDPGMSGAIALLPDSPKLSPTLLDLPTISTKVKTSKKGMPILGNRNSYDFWALVACLDPLIDINNLVTYVLERGQPQADDTPKTAFSIGVSYGIWPMYFVAFGFSFEEVQPAVWKRAFGLLGKDKEASRLLALKAFPSVSEFLRCKSDSDRAEALLIARYSQLKRKATT